MKSRLARFDKLHSLTGRRVVKVQHVQWPALERACRALARLARATEAGGCSDALDGVLRAGWAWRTRALGQVSQTPITEALGLLDALDAAMLAGLDGAHGSLLAQLRMSLAEVGAAKAHPAAEALTLLICEYGAPEDDPRGADVRVLVSKHDRESMRGWLNEEELDAELVTLSELRKSPVRRGLVVLGSAGRVLKGRYCSPDKAELDASWVYHASPAEVVHVLSWSGHARVDPNSTRLPVDPPLRVEFAEGTEEVVEEVELLSLRFSSIDFDIAPPRIPAPRLPADDLVEAHGLYLPGERWAFFAEDHGARPLLLTSGEGQGTSSRRLESALDVKVGEVLIFHDNQLASSPEMRRRTLGWIAQRRGEEAPGLALAAQARLLNTLRATVSARGRTEVVKAFASALPSDSHGKLGPLGYARAVIPVMLAGAVSAPRHISDYQVLAQVLGLSAHAELDWPHLNDLRTGARLAAKQINAEMVAALNDDLDWQESLAAERSARVCVPGLPGVLSLEVVLAAGGKSMVSPSWLGKVQGDFEMRGASS
jgi:hypothetical protein